MNKLSVFLLTATLALSANSQHTYRFSEIDWTDRIDAIDAKLRKAGFSGCAAVELLLCKVRRECTCNFSDKTTATTGMAFIVDEKLSVITASVPDIERTRALLVKKYGPPQPKWNLTDSGIIAQSLENQTSRWTSPNGETLTLAPGFGLTYTSAETNLKSLEKQRSSDSRL